MSYIKQAEQKLMSMSPLEIHEFAAKLGVPRSESRLMAIIRITEELEKIQKEPKFASELSTIGIEVVPDYVNQEYKKIIVRMRKDKIYFPIIIQAQVQLKSETETKTVTSGKAATLDTPEDLRIFLMNVVDNTIKYKHIVQGFTYAGIEAKVQNETKTKSFVAKVADAQIENCVINILRQCQPAEKIEKIYKEFPLLRPTDSDQKIFVNHGQIMKFAKTLGLKIVTYTELGAKIDVPWHIYGNAKSKQVKIKIAKEHATLIPKKLKIDKIVYHDELDEKELRSIHIVDRVYENKPGGPLQFYTKVEDGALVIHKEFKPSSVTRNEADDADLKSAYNFDKNQYLSKLFKKTFNLTPVIDTDLRAITKASEHFIGRKVFEKIDASKAYTEFDQNKNYISYELSEFYKGFPSNTLSPSFHPVNPAFVVCQIYSAPESFMKFYSYQNGAKIVLAYPTFEYLKSHQIEIDVEYYLNTDSFQHISIIDFAEKQNICAEDKKFFRNQLIGTTITGGLNEAKIIPVYPANEEEKQQILFECSQNNLKYQIRDGEIRVELPNKTKGLFNFHSYILAFAGIHMMQKYKELTDKGRKIVGFCVDALIVKGVFREHEERIGGWTTDWPAHYFYSMEPKDTIYRPPKLPSIKVPIRDIPLKNTLFTGPAGIGKSYPWKSDPAYKQSILTPTHNLKDDHRKMFLNTHTAHHYFQFGTDDEKYNLLKCLGKIESNPAYVIIDEFTMFDKKQWQTILKRKGNSILIALGDFEQIRNEIDSEAVNEQFFIDHSFDIKEIKRTELSVARHEFKYGCLLDTLRNKPFFEQKKIINNGPWKKVKMEEISLTEKDHIIAGSHAANYKYHQFFKTKLSTFPFKTIEKRPKIVYLPTDTPNVFWDRLSMKNKPEPTDLYEPCLSITADSYQGTTAEVNLFIDVESLRRHGCLYTAMTRTRKAENTMLIN